MVTRKSWQQKCFGIFNVCFLLSLVIVCAYPVLYVAFASFSVPNQFLAHTGILLKPLGFTTLAYRKAVAHPLILSAYANTIFVVVVGCAVNLLLTSIGAYFLSRRDVYFKKALALGMIFTMYFSGGLIPFYFTVRDIGLYNSLWALILPAAISTFNMLVLKTGFEAIPESLEESAFIDGAGHFTILFKIIIPLSLPTIAVILLYYGVGHWNAWFNASIFIEDRKKYPLQLVLRQILLTMIHSP